MNGGCYLSKPAILWSNPSESRPACDYWITDFLPVQKVGDKSHLPYDTTLLITSFITNTLRGKIRDAFQNQPPSNHEIVAVPIILTIPEGPLLPLSVLAVHALNVPFPLSNGVHCYAVLVPVEPSEGKERIRRLMSTSRASLILCTEANRLRFEEITASLEPTETSFVSLPENHSLYQSNLPTILDFTEIAQNATKDVQLELLKHPDRTQLNGDLHRCVESETLQESLANCTQRLSQGDWNYQTDYWLKNRLSHCAFTSGSTGIPKGSTSSTESLYRYIQNKNSSHEIDQHSVVLLASALSFDPCFSDILATLQAKATLVIASRSDLSQNLPVVLKSLDITHVLCTPSLWGSLNVSSHGGMVRPSDFPQLRVIALGGEPIPKHIVQTWARRCKEDKSCRLFATYGVTEAAVYQTMGEVMMQSPSNSTRGPTVGQPFDGMHVRVCQEKVQNELVDVGEMGGVGEIVLFGCQLDHWSSYLNSPELTQQKFLPATCRLFNEEEKSVVYYRTGDRGFVSAETGNLVILGRIDGQEGMVKINGIRVELGEIEAALVDDCIPSPDGFDDIHPVVLDAAVVAKRDESNSPDSSAVEIYAYCVLSKKCAEEMELSEALDAQVGILCNSKAMLTLLQSRCKENVRAGCTPSVFIFVERFQLLRLVKGMLLHCRKCKTASCRRTRTRYSAP